MKEKHIMVREFDDGCSIVREERENHPGRQKACLYYYGNKAAVCKDGKIRLKTHLQIPHGRLKDLEDEGKRIVSEEITKGLVATT